MSKTFEKVNINILQIIDNLLVLNISLIETPSMNIQEKIGAKVDKYNPKKDLKIVIVLIF